MNHPVVYCIAQEYTLHRKTIFCVDNCTQKMLLHCVIVQIELHMYLRFDYDDYVTSFIKHDFSHLNYIN